MSKRTALYKEFEETLRTTDFEGFLIDRIAELGREKYNALHYNAHLKHRNAALEEEITEVPTLCRRYEKRIAELKGLVSDLECDVHFWKTKAEEVRQVNDNCDYWADKAKELERRLHASPEVMTQRFMAEELLRKEAEATIKRVEEWQKRFLKWGTLLTEPAIQEFFKALEQEDE